VKLPTNKYGTHHLYAYKGAMHPGLARHMIQLCDPIYKDVIFDPFCGSGTIPVEAVMLGHQCVAMDALPTATVATQVKTHFAPGEEPDMDAPETRLHMLMAGRENLLFAHSDIVQAFDEMRRLVEQQDIRLGECETIVGDARQMDWEHQFDHIVTSPPYGALIDYVEESTIPLMALGFTRDRIEKLREQMMDRAPHAEDIFGLSELFRRAIKPTGSVCIAIGKDQYGTDYPAVWAKGLEDAGFIKHCSHTHRYESRANQIPEEEIMHYVVR